MRKHQKCNLHFKNLEVLKLGLLENFKLFFIEQEMNRR